MKIRQRGTLICLCVVALTPLLRAQTPTTPHSFNRQFGTTSDDFAFSVAEDASSIYVAGYQNDVDVVPAFNPCRTSAESTAVESFLRKYSDFGTESSGFIAPGTYAINRDVAVDSGGNIYVVGQQAGIAYVRKYGPSGGTPQWSSPFGPAGTVPFSVAVNAAGVYVAGEFNNGTNSDGIVSGYTSTGTWTWTQSITGSASAYDSARGIAADATAVYVVGYVDFSGTSSPDADAFVSKYAAADGTLLWANQPIGTPADDFAYDVATNGRAVYIVGETQGILGQATFGAQDAFVQQYDFSGNLLWTRQFGTPSADFAVGVTVGGGGTYVVGYTGGQLPGQTPLGQSDAYVRKYNSSGNDVWTTQFGTSAQDAAFGVSSAGGDVYVSGCTNGKLPGQNKVGGDISVDSDAFFAKNPQFPVLVTGQNNGPLTIKLGSQGAVPVAILSTDTFDATTVNPTSISLAGASVNLKGNGTYMASAQDVNGDGRLDLVVHVATEALELSETDTEAVLEGETFAGQAIIAKYLVRIVP